MNAESYLTTIKTTPLLVRDFSSDGENQFTLLCDYSDPYFSNFSVAYFWGTLSFN